MLCQAQHPQLKRLFCLQVPISSPVASSSSPVHTAAQEQPTNPPSSDSQPQSSLPTGQPRRPPSSSKEPEPNPTTAASPNPFLQQNPNSEAAAEHATEGDSPVSSSSHAAREDAGSTPPAAASQDAASGEGKQQVSLPALPLTLCRKKIHFPLSAYSLCYFQDLQ